MGNKQTKITYETVDKTDPGAREQGRQEALDDNQCKLQELDQRLQQEEQRTLEKAESIAKGQNAASMADLELRIRDERERLSRRKAAAKKAKQEAMEQKAFLQMKNSLLDYKIGSRIGKATFKELDISDINNIRIVLIGPTGSGKTSFIGTLERTLLQDKHTAYAQGAGSEGTVNLEEYLSELKFNLVDTRGFFDIDEQTFVECLNIMEGRLFVGDTIQRDYDGSDPSGRESSRPAAKFSDQAHAVVFVVMANDPRLRGGEYLERMRKLRDHFRSHGHSPVTVITALDKLKTEDEKDKAYYEASAATGSPRDRTFFISNYTHENDAESFLTEQQAANIIDSVLYSAERYVKIQKLRLKHHGHQAPGDARGVETLQQLFSKLQVKYQWEPAKVSRVVKAFQEKEILTADALKACWEEMKDSMGMSVGMKRLVGEELKNV